MAWHHHLHSAVKSHATSFAMQHPWLTTILVLSGISAVATVASGSHATPTPAAQNPTPAKGA